MKVRRLTNVDARRIAVRAQLLDADRPDDLLAMAQRLTFLQLDPTAVVAPNADLVSWTRLGNAYRPEHLRRALEVDRAFFEHRGQETGAEPVVAMLRPMSNLGLFLTDMRTIVEGTARSEWMKANAGFRQRILDQLRAEGPLASRDLPDTAELSWTSTGWTNDRNVTQMLEFLSSRGEVAVSSRRGKQRLWDIAERVHPGDVAVVPAEEARSIRDRQRLRSLGVARPKVVGEAGERVEIEGTVGEWRVDPDATAAGFRGRTALLSPFDRLVHDRNRTLDLFGFEYTLEMYKPKHNRRWGYFALPILHLDRLVGKVDAAADRKRGLLVVHALHEDVPFTAAMSKAVRAELGALAAWLQLDGVELA